MANGEVIRWNVGLGIVFAILIFGYLGKLRYDLPTTDTTGGEISKLPDEKHSEEEKNLLTLLLLVNGLTIVYWISWPCPYKFSSPIARLRFNLKNVFDELFLLIFQRFGWEN